MPGPVRPARPERWFAAAWLTGKTCGPTGEWDVRDATTRVAREPGKGKARASAETWAPRGEVASQSGFNGGCGVAPGEGGGQGEKNAGTRGRESGNGAGYRERVHSHLWVVDFEFAVTTVDDIHNAVHCQTGLGDVGRNDAFPGALFCLIEDLGLAWHCDSARGGSQQRRGFAALEGLAAQYTAGT